MDSDLAARLERAMSPMDLGLPGAAIVRKLAPALAGRGSIVGLQRVGEDRSTLFVFLRETRISLGKPFFVFAGDRRVHVIAIPLTGDYGTTRGLWRRKDDRIVGGLIDIQGNWSTIAVAALTRRRSRWKLAAFRETEGEASDVKFLGDGVDRLRVSTRSYDFRRMNQSHAGPLLIRDAVWTVRNGRIVEHGSHLRRTPLEALDRFADAILRGDAASAKALCAPALFKRARRSIEDAADEEGRIDTTCPRDVMFDEGRFLGVDRSGREDRRPFFVMARSRKGWRIAAIRAQNSFPKSRDLQKPR